MTWYIFCVGLVITIDAVIFCNSFPIRMKNREIVTNRPIIGVLAQSTTGESFKVFGPSYIAASYIKYLESSGARVVPIMDDLSEDEIEKLFYSINGVLFPGGRANLTSSGYAKTGRIIYNLAKKSNDNGDYFPLWGTCLGFEFLSSIVADTVHILSGTDSQNLALPLNFSRNYLNSRIFRTIPKNLAKFLSDAPTTANFHHMSVTVEKFKQSKEMTNFFKVLSTNNDRNGIQFVSTMEGKQYPFYGTQWHPEKNSFEWSPKITIPHEAMAIKVTQYMSNFFVDEARYSKHKFASVEEEQAALIYNYFPTYTGKMSHFEQCYIFNHSSSVALIKN